MDGFYFRNGQGSAIFTSSVLGRVGSKVAIFDRILATLAMVIHIVGPPPNNVSYNLIPPANIQFDRPSGPYLVVKVSKNPLVGHCSLKIERTDIENRTKTIVGQTSEHT
jgi:hypothetical protein